MMGKSYSFCRMKEPKNALCGPHRHLPSPLDGFDMDIVYCALTGQPHRSALTVSAKTASNGGVTCRMSDKMATPTACLLPAFVCGLLRAN